jgi:hypothetical protein
MNDSRTRLAILWSAFFVLNLALATYFYFSQGIEADNYKKLLAELNTSYAPYLGAILLFFWTRRDAPRPSAPGKEPNRKLAFHLAFAFSLLWNLLIFLLLARLFLSGTIEDSLERMADFRGIFSWLVAGSTGFYFGTNR